MEILPGVGMATVKVGDTREAVESRLGAPSEPGKADVCVYDGGRVSVSYTADGRVERVVAWHNAGSGDEVSLDGVQLTWRFLDDVVADLTAKGYHYEYAEYQGLRFEAGFVLFSSGARVATDLDPEAADDDPRPVCDGVSIAPYEYFLREPAGEQIAAWDREIAEFLSMPEDPS